MPDAPRRASFLPFSRPTLAEEEEQEVLEVLRSGWLTTGPRVQRFEEAFRERIGAAHAVAVNSCTAGLHLAVATLDLEPGDEVIVPAITWPATANVVEHCRGRTVFADVDPETVCLDPEDVRRRVTPRTRAIMPVHFAGQPVDLAAIRELAAESRLALVEDAAHALGARYGDEGVGEESELAVFSFQPNKNITTGEGGMIVCRDPERARRMRLLRFHGVTRDTWKRSSSGGTPHYEVEEPGWKYNMLDLEAAIGLHQLGKLDDFNARRAGLAARYDELLADLPEVRPLGRVAYPATHAWHIYAVRLELAALRIDRDAFQKALQEEQIGTGLHYPAVHLLAYYREKYGYGPGSLPAAEAVGESILSLPLFPRLEKRDQDDVVAALRRVIAAHRR